MAERLFLVQLPPPLHGAAYMNQIVIDELWQVNDTVINLSMNAEIGDVGKVSAGKIFRTLGVLLRVTWRLVSRKEQVVYHTPGTGRVAVARDLLIARAIWFARTVLRRRIKYVTHWHSAPASDISPTSRLARMTCAILDASTPIFLSQWHQDRFKALGWHGAHGKIIGNGIPDQNPEPEAAVHCLNEDRVYRMLFLSNMIESKGYKEALAIGSSLAGANPAQQFHLTFAGPFPTEAAKTEFVRLAKNVPNNLVIDVVGARYGDDKVKLLCQSDCLVFPTRYEKEVFPVTIIEGLQFNLKIITTRHASIPEMVGETYAFFPEDEPDVAALTDYLRQPVVSTPRDHYLANYTVRSMADRLDRELKN